MSKRAASSAVGGEAGPSKKSSSASAAGGVNLARLPFCPPHFDSTRARVLTQSSQLADGECVVYWMSRDQRADDNWALLYAKGVADARNVPLKVVFKSIFTAEEYGEQINKTKFFKDMCAKNYSFDYFDTLDACNDNTDIKGNTCDDGFDLI